jgi:hypothetical protein
MQYFSKKQQLTSYIIEEPESLSKGTGLIFCVSFIIFDAMVTACPEKPA